MSDSEAAAGDEEGARSDSGMSKDGESGSTLQLQGDGLGFEVERIGSGGEFEWRARDTVNEFCCVRGRNLGCLIGSAGEIWTARGDVKIRKERCCVVPEVEVDALVVSAEWGTAGLVEVRFALHGSFLCIKMDGSAVTEDLVLKELIVWDGEVVLGNGKRGYEDLDSGVLVDGIISFRWAAVAVLSIAMVYIGVAHEVAEIKAVPMIFAHFAALCLLFILAVRGVYRGLIKGPRTMFTNGWQSWGFCGSVKMGTRQPVPALHSYFTRAMHVGANGDLLPPNRSYGRSMRYFSDMLTAVYDTDIRAGVVAGFLSQRQHFGGIHFDRIMRTGVARCAADDQQLAAGGSFGTDWFAFQLLSHVPEEPLADYFDLVSVINPAAFGDFGKTPLGWCSWYYYFLKVTAEDLQSNLKHLAAGRSSAPLEIFQLDDGYQLAWGDWEPKSTFPTDMHEVSEKIQHHGFQPGIWLAPFSADIKSDLAKTHPDWILRDGRGRIANSGNCGKFFCGLDASNPEVVENARNCITKLTKEWGFSYVKLDFLYSSVLSNSPRYDQTRTRAQIFDDAVRMLREAVGPDVFLVGCGCPLGTAVGYFNAMRIGPDVDKNWLPFIRWDKWNLPGARSAVRNTLTRSSMHRRLWVNDPDCVLFREGTLFTDEEITGIATAVAMGGGMFMLSDEMGQVREKRYRIATSLMPPAPQASIALDLLEREDPTELLLRMSGESGSWVVLALCNWTQRAAERSFELSKLFPGEETAVHVLEFWSQNYVKVNSDAPLAVRIPGRSAKLFAIRAASHDESLQYVGSDFHFTSGAEVSHLEYAGDTVHVEFDVHRSVADSYAWVQVPFSGDLSLSGDAHDSSREPESVGGRVWRIPVSFDIPGGKLTIGRAT